MVYRFFADADRLTWASIGVTVVVGFLYFRLFFPRRDGFDDLPDDYSTWIDYQWAKWKIIAFIMLSAGTGILAYHQLPGWFPHIFKR